MMSSYTVESLREHHLDACYNIAHMLWGENIANSIWGEIKDGTCIEQQFPTRYIVARTLSGEVIGFAGFRRALFMPNAWEFIWANVREDHQRNGVGKLMVDYRTDLIRQVGGKLIQASTKTPEYLASFKFVTIYVFEGWHVMIKTLT